jgi:hypothetical protein
MMLQYQNVYATRGRLRHFLGLVCKLAFLVALGFTLTTTSCAPIPCASGYADPNWCRHFSGGGGDGG